MTPERAQTVLESYKGIRPENMSASVRAEFEVAQKATAGMPPQAQPSTHGAPKELSALEQQIARERPNTQPGLTKTQEKNLIAQLEPYAGAEGNAKFDAEITVPGDGTAFAGKPMLHGARLTWQSGTSF